MKFPALLKRRRSFQKTWKWSWERPPGPEDLSPFSEDAEQYAARFVAFALAHGGRVLDGSEASLDEVETLLAELSRTTRHMSAEGRTTIINEAAFYILEVARRHFGGVYQLYVQREQFVLVVNEPECRVGLLAHDKVEGRLNGDEMDNIPFLSQTFSRPIAEKRSAK